MSFEEPNEPTSSNGGSQELSVDRDGGGGPYPPTRLAHMWVDMLVHYGQARPLEVQLALGDFATNYVCQSDARWNAKSSGNGVSCLATAGMVGIYQTAPFRRGFFGAIAIEK